ncbi:NUDIX hydrolase [Corynebacterium suedekumii]|uniref:NUDIX domain-containing protein n=1 Tax=Corynebacterium suedekumii TaxID=3049801 RepID=A0ABY8VIS3_9CORY|nr:NUDIX domain-containing protein [Corynebacterium suedekumii]WIM69571.1 NUDIX domain-containing protein [Corynebacterium suedekumii]
MTTVAICVVRPDGAVLLLRGPRGWEFPTGELLNKDPGPATAIRTLREDLGITVTPRRVGKIGTTADTMLVVAAPDDADLTLKAGDTRKPAWVPRLRLQQYRDEQGFAPELQGLMESQADRLLKDLAKNPAGKDRRHTFGFMDGLEAVASIMQLVSLPFRLVAAIFR